MRPDGPPFLVGLTGAVAVGKSTLAEALRDELTPLRVEVVATDGFLRGNDDLGAAGLLARKGFPETYDAAAMATFLSELRAGRPGPVPVYSHVTYDRVPGEVRLVADADVVVVEGVNALQPEVADALDLRVYLHAEEPLVRSWYVDRFLALTTAAETDETSFYRRFVPLDDEQRRQMAVAVWEGVNLVNLREHIEPTRARADVVLTKVAGHALA